MFVVCLRCPPTSQKASNVVFEKPKEFVEDSRMIQSSEEEDEGNIKEERNFSRDDKSVQKTGEEAEDGSWKRGGEGGPKETV